MPAGTITGKGVVPCKTVPEQQRSAALCTLLYANMTDIRLHYTLLICLNTNKVPQDTLEVSCGTYNLGSLWQRQRTLVFYTTVSPNRIFGIVVRHRFHLL